MQPVKPAIVTGAVAVVDAVCRSRGHLHRRSLALGQARHWPICLSILFSPDPHVILPCAPASQDSPALTDCYVSGHTVPSSAKLPHHPSTPSPHSSIPPLKLACFPPSPAPPPVTAPSQLCKPRGPPVPAPALLSPLPVCDNSRAKMGPLLPMWPQCLVQGLARSRTKQTFAV